VQEAAFQVVLLSHPHRTRNQKGMVTENHSTVTEFILQGLTERPELQLPLLFLFLGIYLVTMIGNLGVITLICLNAQLHTPMYYFLSNLSFVDLCYSSVITPEHHLLCRVHGPALLLPGVCHCWVLHADSDGLWPLCCHLQTSVLQHHHVSSSLLPADGWGNDRGVAEIHKGQVAEEIVHGSVELSI